MNCPKCGIENPEGANFCLRCGKPLTVEEPGTLDGEAFCYRHPKIATRLACGRCGRPVCTKCVVLGPAGPRCRECSRQQVTVRPGAVVHSARVGIRRIFQGGPWTIYLWIVMIGLVVSAFRGCGHMLSQRQMPQERREVPTDDR